MPPVVSVVLLKSKSACTDRKKKVGSVEPILAYGLSAMLNIFHYTDSELKMHIFPYFSAFKRGKIQNVSL